MKLKSTKIENGKRVIRVTSMSKRTEYHTEWIEKEGKLVCVNNRKIISRGDHPKDVNQRKIRNLHGDNAREYIRKHRD